jgi:hypothetical protein
VIIVNRADLRDFVRQFAADSRRRTKQPTVNLTITIGGESREAAAPNTDAGQVRLELAIEAELNAAFAEGEQQRD